MKKESAAAPMANHDDDTFAEVVAKAGGFGIPRPPAPPPAQKHDMILSPDANDDDAPFANTTIFTTNGIASKRLKTLRKQSPDGSVDLHGDIAEDAWMKLNAFLSQAIADEMRHVEIVHGKGSHSPDGRAVLRSKTRKWLARCDFVLGYIESAGNPGAMRVLLRGKK